MSRKPPRPTCAPAYVSSCCVPGVCNCFFVPASVRPGFAALDLQAQAKEREQRLQLAEYELRLAKEDLAEMHKRLEQVRVRGVEGLRGK